MERIQLLNPEGKKGSNIVKEKYDLIKHVMLETIKENGEISFKELANVINEKLHGKWEGSITWYVTAVKLDLEARGLIERFPKKRQQNVRISEGD
ncbi:hypothetical protein [Paucisalibacillus sp. EB02]|uniref:DUF6958 family protein n=1 Tax=Paucisalibacillus sp. EB02 TaxID=1347087 RepID=UPI0005AACA33|nr:hypothetical protein [Paucisalibacillus sp. EB02]